MAEKYQLLYFNKRGGGEIIRLVFVTAGVQYEDIRLDMAEWLKLKSDMPMRCLPCLKIIKGERTFIHCQSGAIAKYLARKFGLYTDNEDDNLLIDEMYDSVGDVRNVFVQVQLCKDEATKKDLNEKLLTEMLPKFASFFKLRKNDFGGNGYIIGSKMTLADLAVFNMVDSCIEMGLESLWKPYPLLLEHRQNVIKDTNIAKWLQTRPRTEV
ncbi:S-crystallin SL11-like isoform X1 [Mercenaria mercenaria]|uniref:S-crystallin SL11-like isoform X1 n=1 Tax=Mercenaria mercenaria TaxID=6596 RepID=UPI00234E481E|nr:S-crystallin SL11-like isoform X1 [Mercenaria mercenaria]